MDTEDKPAGNFGKAVRQSSWRTRAFAVGALLVWLGSVLAHDLGEAVAQWFFSWVQEPGRLHPDGGRAAFARAEFLIGLVCVVGAVGVLAAIAWRGRRVPWRQWEAVALAWALWAALVYLMWLFFIVYTTELVHFVQYGIVGALAAAAFGYGRRPHSVFLIVYALGLVDELWQHFGLRRWVVFDPGHWMDWSDPLLNGLGAVGGVLVFVSWAVLSGVPVRFQFKRIQIAFVAAAVVLLPLLLLDEVTVARYFGSYTYYPFWNEFANAKPVHWPSLYEGIPLNLAGLLVLGAVLDPLRHRAFLGLATALALLLAVAVDPPRRGMGQPVHEVVPTVKAPWVANNGSQAAIVVDGVLDEAAWQGAGIMGPMVNNVDGLPEIDRRVDGVVVRGALQQTLVRVLWDQEALYLGVEVEDNDIWARPAERDGIGWKRDELIDISIDDGGDEITFYTFRLNPLNVQYDAFVFIPKSPMDYNAWNRQLGLPHWDARGWQSAVQVDGTLDVVPTWQAQPAADRDRGYTAEMVIPWENFRTTSTPGGVSVRQTVYPQPGERWRLAVSRVEWPRVAKQVLVGGDESVDRDTVRRLLGVSAEEVARLVERNYLDLINGDPNRLRLRDVQWRAAQNRQEWQAWTPTYYHNLSQKPSRFGVIEFIKE